MFRCSSEQSSPRGRKWTGPKSTRRVPNTGALPCYGEGMANYLDQAIATLRRFEGSIPWMYLDTVGKVTVGVGLMLSNEQAAHALPFLNGTDAATPTDISRDFARVSAMKKGGLATLYRQGNSLRLSDETIDQRLRQAVLGFEGYLRSHVPGYENLPDAAKVALLDMAYNLGPGRLFTEYSHLLNAIAQGDWQAAAAASLRRGPSAERNTWTRQQFLDAASATLAQVKAEATSNPWFTVLLGTVSGLAAAAATAIIAGELDRYAAERRRESAQAN